VLGHFLKPRPVHLTYSGLQQVYIKLSVTSMAWVLGVGRSKSFSNLHHETSDLHEAAVPDSGAERLQSRGRSDAQTDDIQEDVRYQSLGVCWCDDEQSHFAVPPGLQQLTHLFTHVND